jgi:hypothetical protein
MSASFKVGLCVVRNSVDGKAACLAQGGADVVFGTAGRLAPEKNMALLIHGYALMRQKLQAAQVPLGHGGDSDSSSGSGGPGAAPPLRTRLLLVRAVKLH